MEKYEIVLTHQDHEPLLVGYSPSKALDDLIRVLKRSGDHISVLIGIVGDTEAAIRKDHIHFSHGWQVRYSGRTRQQAEQAGERTHVNDITQLDYQPLI